MRGFIVVLVLLYSGNIIAQRSLDLTSDLLYAYDKILSLEFKEAQILIATHKNKHPNNALPYFFENYIDFLSLYISEDPNLYETNKKNKDIRLQILEEADKNSPYYLYCQAEIRLHWALNRIKFKEYKTAFFEISKAFSLLEENKKKYPDFIANDKSLGVLHALIGAIPDSYKWGVKLIGGMDGSIQQGLRELKRTIDYAQKNYYPFEKESIVLYGLLTLELANEKESAWKIINNPQLNPRLNPLVAYLQASVAIKTGRNDKALEIISNVPKGEKFYPFPFTDFLHGLALLNKTDISAEVYFKKFLSSYKGRNYIKETYQKLAWIEILKNNRPGYQLLMEKVLTVGHNDAEEDKQAQKEAESKIIPLKSLLITRLLYDGGYYSKALEIIKAIDVKTLTTVKNQLEWSYRKARIMHSLKDYSNALTNYKSVIDKGRQYKYIYATNSALQCGLIYEELKNYGDANAYYQLVLTLNPEEYKDSMHAKAKAGLNRIKNK